MLPSITSILANADPNTQVGSQPRHPKSGVYQGMPHASARKGFAQEQSPEVADSSKGKGEDDPNHPAEEIEDEGDMIGQGDRPQKPRVTGGVPESRPAANARRDANKERRDGDDEDEDEDEDDDETYNALAPVSGAPAPRQPSPNKAPPIAKPVSAEPSSGGDSNAKLSGTAASAQAAGEAGAVKYAGAHGTLGRAIGRAASSVAHPIETAKGQGSLLIHHPGVAIKAAARSVVHPIKHSDDFGIDKPEEHKFTPGEAGQHKGHFGGEPMFEDTPHDQTLRAAGASLAHPASREHAMGAMDASMAGDSKRAAVLHRKSAKEHLNEANQHMIDGNKEQADAHLQAAMMHHKAATHHMGCSAGMARNTQTTTTTEVQRPKPQERNSTVPKINRKNVIDFIVVNCDCAPTGGLDATRNTLKQKSDQELLGLKSKLLGLITANAKAEGSFADTKGKGGKGMMAGGMGYGADDEVTYEEDEDDSTEEEPEQAEDAFTGKNNMRAENQRSGPMNREEWMAAAPPEIREVVRNAEANDNREKLDLHRRITLIANSQHQSRKALILNELQGIKTKKGLQKLLGLVIPTEGITDNEEAQQVYRGAGAPEASITDNQAQDDILVSPTINWAEEHEDARDGKARRTSTVSSGR